MLLSVGGGAPKAPDGSLALALGVAIAEGLEAFISDHVELKWPNDLVAQDRKLGGILVETSTQANLGGRTSRPPERRDAFAPGSSAHGGAETRVVAGLGVNIRVSEEQRKLVTGEGGLRPAGLSELNLRKAPEPNVLAAAMITAIADVLESHPVDGFGRWADGWNGRDWLAGMRIEARSGVTTYMGVAAGVDSSGALLLEDSDGQRRIVSAEIRL